jgi:phosphate transport system substrate-binding protein
MPLSEESMRKLGIKVLHFPVIVGGVVPIYNIGGVVKDLNFTPETLAGIYTGAIRKWNDPRLRAANRGAALPDREIAVVHRSDGSGTTFVFTDYLSKVSPEWSAKLGAGTAVKWPLGAGARGSEGVAELVRNTPDSIGYVELIYALQNRLSFGAVKNRAGRFIQADLASLTAAAGASENLQPDLRVSITDAAGKDAYPIASFTWLLVPERMPDEAKRNAMAETLQWALSSGQRQCSALGYAPLPEEIVKRALHLLEDLR